MTDPIDAATRAIALAIGRPVIVETRTPLGGGCIGRTERIDTSAGAFVLKWLPDAPPDLFTAEAAGLQALRDSGTTLVVPAVIAVSGCGASGWSSFLVIEYLTPGTRARDFDERLGRGLAQLHRATHHGFGFSQPTYCGATLQPNGWSEHWVPFYASQRLGHQLELASRAGEIDAADRRAIERLISRIGTWLVEPPEGPALIHGDLWSGNLCTTADGHPALVDPAVSYSHREAELGMMTLFGGFSARVFDAYHEAFPLEAGWRDRNPLYQLYHVLNHVNLFGAGYLGQMRAIVRRYA